MNSQNATREERRKENELNEARKAGKIEALKDEEGNDINPHMPQYIIKAPWYLNQTKPGLKHQRYRGTEKVKIEEERNKKIFLKKEKGKEFCKNCGSITHQEKFCLERTRKRKVNFMKKTEDEKEFIYVNQDLGFDGNRDRWVGYNADNFKYVIEEYEKIVEEKKKRKAEELKKKYERTSIKKKKKDDTNETNGNVKEDDDGDTNDDVDGNSRNDSDSSKKEDKKKEKKKKKKERTEKEDEEKDAEEKDGEEDDNKDDEEDDDEDNDLENKERTVGVVESAHINAVNKNEKNRTITRNLRIREDTAKYLYNLSLNSAFYDPKSRSMREDPFANISKNVHNNENNILQDSTYYKGENYYNNTGDAIESKKLEVFAWHTYKRGENVHFNAQPTQLELLYKEFIEKKKKLITKKQENILKTYNCENVTKDVNDAEELEQSEVYREYKPMDQISQSGLEKKKIQVLSKYEEDIYSFGHTSVYGSYYDRDKKKWGYRCCRVTNKFDKCPLI